MMSEITTDNDDLKKNALDYVYYLFGKNELEFREYFDVMKDLKNTKDGDDDVILDVSGFIVIMFDTFVYTHI